MAAVSTATAGEGIRAQIAQVDQQIATSAEQLGPNHPAMQALRGQRVALERQLAQAQAAAQRAASMAMSAASGGAAQMEQTLEQPTKQFLASTAQFAQLAQVGTASCRERACKYG